MTPPTSKYPTALFAEYQALLDKQKDMELSARDQIRLRAIRKEMAGIDAGGRTEEDIPVQLRSLRDRIAAAVRETRVRR
jgi:hypothetical protein